MTTKITVSVDRLRRALLCVNKDTKTTHPIRALLTGVLIEASPIGGVRLVGMNGHCGVVIHDPDGTISGKPIVFEPSKDMAKALKKVTPRQTYADIEVTETEVGLDHTITDTRCLIVSRVSGVTHEFKDDQFSSMSSFGPYPEWLRAFPIIEGTDTSVDQRYDPTLMSVVSDAVNEGETGHSFHARAVKRGHAAIVLGNDPYAVGIIMPLRDGRFDDFTLPDFVKYRESVVRARPRLEAKPESKGPLFYAKGE